MQCAATEDSSFHRLVQRLVRARIGYATFRTSEMSERDIKCLIRGETLLFVKKTEVFNIELIPRVYRTDPEGDPLIPRVYREIGVDATLNEVFIFLLTCQASATSQASATTLLLI